MSLDRLLNQPLSIERRSGVSTDAYGNEVSSTNATVPTVGYLEQTDATEITIDRETYITNWQVVLLPDISIDGSDWIVYGTMTLEVVGKPHRVWNPRRRAEHHVECRCREVTGAVVVADRFLLESGSDRLLTEGGDVLVMEG